MTGMTGRLLHRGRGTPDPTDPSRLAERLAALSTVVELGRGRLPDEAVSQAELVVGRAGQRLRLSGEHTVVALAGATGSGKSSLFNALAGLELSTVGVRRPTTGHAHACVWGAAGAGPLLDWLGIPQRHQVERETALDADREAALRGLVLLDLPDHDSTELAHRLEVDRLVGLVDLLVWVLDPQKYADAAVHERYLRPLARHRDVVVVVLNQIDRLDPGAAQSCLGDLRRLLGEDGLGSARLLPVSARTGTGVQGLRDQLTAAVRQRRAAAGRLSADIDGIVSSLQREVGEGAAGEVSAAARRDLVATLADAAGVHAVGVAAQQSHRRDATLATGSPLARWVTRWRPDPLARLHLRPGRSSPARTSLPQASPVQHAGVDLALGRLADAAAGGLAPPWSQTVRTAARSHADQLPRELDRAVAGGGELLRRRPGWWRAAGAAQWLLLAAALVGLVWLVAIGVVAWLRLPDLPAPNAVGPVPWPTVLLLGGVLLGLLLALACRPVAAAGARRVRARAERAIRDRVAEVADAHVIEPVRAELAAHERLCAALDRARGAPVPVGRGAGEPAG